MMKIFRLIFNFIKLIFYFKFTYILLSGIFLITSLLFFNPRLFIFTYTNSDYNISINFGYINLSIIGLLSFSTIYYYRKLLFRNKKYYLDKKKSIDQNVKLIQTCLFRETYFQAVRDKSKLKFFNCIKVLSIIHNIFTIALAVILTFVMKVIFDFWGFVNCSDPDYSNGIDLPMASYQDVKFYNEWYDIFISIDKNSNIKIDNIPISFEELENLMIDAKKELLASNWVSESFEFKGREIHYGTSTKFFFYADKDLKMEILNNIFYLLRDTGFKGCVLMTN